MEKNEIETALEAGAARAPAHDMPDGGKLLIVPERHKSERIAPLRPATIKQGVVIHDRDSFSAYVNRFKTEATRIFCEPGFLSPSKVANVTAVIDYHGPKEADNGAHTVTYCPRYSEQWTRWHKACAEPMKQAEFAEFIEEVRGDIHEPDAAKLLDIVRTFKASKKVEFDSVVYQPNGDVKLGYDERTQQTGSSGALPEVMSLGIPVYYRGSAYRIPVFVRYRVGSGAVAFSLKIDRAEIIEETAFAELTSAISQATIIETYLGRR